MASRRPRRAPVRTTARPRPGARPGAHPPHSAGHVCTAVSADPQGRDAGGEWHEPLLFLTLSRCGRTADESQQEAACGPSGEHVQGRRVQTSGRTEADSGPDDRHASTEPRMDLAPPGHLHGRPRSERLQVLDEIRLLRGAELQSEQSIIVVHDGREVGRAAIVEVGRTSARLTSKKDPAASRGGAVEAAGAAGRTCPDPGPAPRRPMEPSFDNRDRHLPVHVIRARLRGKVTARRAPIARATQTAYVSSCKQDS